jgi:hypothetical protein
MIPLFCFGRYEEKGMKKGEMGAMDERKKGETSFGMSSSAGNTTFHAPKSM